MLIEAFTKERDIVMDWQVSTCNFCFSIVAIQSRFKHPCIVVNAFISYRFLNFATRHDNSCVPL